MGVGMFMLFVLACMIRGYMWLTDVNRLPNIGPQPSGNGRKRSGRKRPGANGWEDLDVPCGDSLRWRIRSQSWTSQSGQQLITSMDYDEWEETLGDDPDWPGPNKLPPVKGRVIDVRRLPNSDDQ